MPHPHSPHSALRMQGGLPLGFQIKRTHQNGDVQLPEKGPDIPTFPPPLPTFPTFPPCPPPFSPTLSPPSPPPSPPLLPPSPLSPLRRPEAISASLRGSSPVSSAWITSGRRSSAGPSWPSSAQVSRRPSGREGRRKAARVKHTHQLGAPLLVAVEWVIELLKSLEFGFFFLGGSRSKLAGAPWCAVFSFPPPPALLWPVRWLFLLWLIEFVRSVFCPSFPFLRPSPGSEHRRTPTKTLRPLCALDFGGFSRTGTKSMETALSQLGYQIYAAQLIKAKVWGSPETAWELHS